MSLWNLSWRADPVARDLADRHYNRQSVGADQFVPPGRCLVLVRPGAFWITSFPFAEFVRHEWAGAWMCSAFRRESGPLASELIRSAVAATRWKYGDAPEPHGMVTFVDRSKVKETHPGYCYKLAGFRTIGETKGGLLALGLAPAEMPPPRGSDRLADRLVH